jgi:hypothetical protein
VVTVAFPGPKGRVGHPDLTQNVGQIHAELSIVLGASWHLFALTLATGLAVYKRLHLSPA